MEIHLTFIHIITNSMVPNRRLEYTTTALYLQCRSRFSHLHAAVGIRRAPKAVRAGSGRALCTLCLRHPPRRDHLPVSARRRSRRGGDTHCAHLMIALVQAHDGSGGGRLLPLSLSHLTHAGLRLMAWTLNSSTQTAADCRGRGITSFLEAIPSSGALSLSMSASDESQASDAHLLVTFVVVVVFRRWRLRFSSSPFNPNAMPLKPQSEDFYFFGTTVPSSSQTNGHLFLLFSRASDAECTPGVERQVGGRRQIYGIHARH